MHDYWKNDSFDYTDLCQQSNGVHLKNMQVSLARRHWKKTEKMIEVWAYAYLCAGTCLCVSVSLCVCTPSCFLSAREVFLGTRAVGIMPGCQRAGGVFQQLLIVQSSLCEASVLREDCTAVGEKGWGGLRLWAGAREERVAETQAVRGAVPEGCCRGGEGHHQGDLGGGLQEADWLQRGSYGD